MNDPAIPSPAVVKIAEAIAIAEGFFVPDSIPNRYNNPGDIEEAGTKVNYLTIQDGWNALYRQIEMMIDGRSHIYNPNMQWTTIGKLYTGEQTYMNWVENVCRILQVSVTSTLAAYCENFGKLEVTINDELILGDKVN